MRRLFVSALLLTALGAAGFAMGAGPAATTEVERSFEGATGLTVSVASSVVVVRGTTSANASVRLTYTYPSDRYRYEMAMEGSSLRLKEEFGPGRVAGTGLWEIDLPTRASVTVNSASGNVTVEALDSTVSVTTASGTITISRIGGDVDVRSASGAMTLQAIRGALLARSASGKLELAGHQGDAQVTTASGDVSVTGSRGELAIDTASGRITLDDVIGALTVSSASGAVDAKGIGLTGNGRFSAASGNVTVILAGTPATDLELSSASGNAILDYNGNEVRGAFTFEARRDNGEIRSPYAFGSETTFTNGGVTYDRKSHTVGSGSPAVSITTASGLAELRR